MPMNYLNILSRLHNVPLAISQDKLSIISSNITIPLLEDHSVTDHGFLPTTAPKIRQEKMGIIQVFDTLVSKGGAGESGFTSYQGIQIEIKSLINSGAHKIGFHIASPGGEADALFALTAFIRSLHTTYGVETFAFTDGTMASAAYAIAAACDTIYCTPQAIVGSIAVIMDLIDVTKMDTNLGIVHHIIRSKEDKAIGNPHEAFTETVFNKYKALLDSMDVLFNNDVAQNRPNLTVDQIVKLKGDVFIGQDALELGLVDSIIDTLDAVVILEGTAQASTTATVAQLETTINNPSTLDKGSTMTLQELEAQLQAAQQELAVMEASNTTKVEAAIAGERSRCVAIIESGKTLNMSDCNIMGRLQAGKSAEDSLIFFTTVAEAVAAATGISTQTSANVLTELPETEVMLEVDGLSASVADILAPLDKGDR